MNLDKDKGTLNQMALILSFFQDISLPNNDLPWISNHLNNKYWYSLDNDVRNDSSFSGSESLGEALISTVTQRNLSTLIVFSGKEAIILWWLKFLIKKLLNDRDTTVKVIRQNKHQTWCHEERRLSVYSCFLFSNSFSFATSKFQVSFIKLPYKSKFVFSWLE